MVQPELEPSITEFLKQYSPDVNELVNQGRGLIREVMPGLLEQLDVSAKMIAYGTDYTYKGLVCGIMVCKNYINIMLAKGAVLPDPDGLLSGTGKKARHIRINHPSDLEKPGVRRILENAMELHSRNV